MKKIVLAFSTTKWISSAFLRWAQRCEFSHIEVMFNAGEHNQYAIGARVTGVKQYTDFKHLVNVTYRTLEVTDEQYEKFYKFIHDAVGLKYDWRAYLGFAAFRVTHKEDSYFCSELVEEAFDAAGINILVNAPAYWSTPRDFWISPILSEPSFIGKI